MPRGAGRVAACRGGAAGVQGALRACFREQFSSGGLLSLSLPAISPSPGHSHLSPAPSHASLGGRGAVAVCCTVALLKSVRLLLLLKDWRRPARTSWAGVTAFLAGPCAWPALPKPGGRQEFCDPERLPLPRGFMKSRSRCRVTCDGQDVRMVCLSCRDAAVGRGRWEAPLWMQKRRGDARCGLLPQPWAPTLLLLPQASAVE